MNRIIKVLVIISLAAAFSCGGNTKQKIEVTTEETPVEIAKNEARVEKVNFMDDRGIGPVSSITLDESINEEMAKSGELLYGQMCSSCHKTDVNFIGPALKDVLDRRSPEWIMNMTLNPQEMVEKNATAKSLLEEFNNVEMTDMGLSEEEARSILEYFRTL